MSGARHRRKGNRVERELVQLHKALGVHAERYPLSGANRFRGSGHDLDIYAFGTEEGPLVAEVKSRQSGDCLFLRRDSAEAMVLLPWRVWVALLAKVRR